MINIANCCAERPGPVQNGDGDQIPEAGPTSAPAAPTRLDWAAYYHQEDKEPFDVIKEIKGSVPRRDLDPDLLLELRVQEFVRRIKMNSQYYESKRANFFDLIKCEIPQEAVVHCKSRLGRTGGVGTLLRWHYYLLMYFAEKDDSMKRALPLMLESAAKTGDDSRASSYITTAHNLNKWYQCRMGKDVLDSAVRFVEERAHNDFTHWCVHIVADLEADPVKRNKMRDAMIHAARRLDRLGAGHCLEAAVRVASDSKPAREACMRLYESHADGLSEPPLMMLEFSNALRYADGAEDRMRLAGKIIRAAGSIKFTKYTHTFEAPSYDLPGGTGPERIRHLVELLDDLISAAFEAGRPGGRDAHEHGDPFSRTTIGSDGMPGPSRPGQRGSEAAAQSDRLVREIQILAAFLSATARVYEDDGRIAPSDHMDVLRSTGLCSGPTAALIEAGIERHHAHDYVSSVHTLLPQLEQVLRLVLRRNGIPVAGAAGAPKYDPMKTVIKRGAVVLGSDLSASLLALLTDMDSINLRNRVCHGLHSATACPAGSNLPHDFGHATSLLLVLIIELVCGRPGREPGRGGGQG